MFHRGEDVIECVLNVREGELFRFFCVTRKDGAEDAFVLLCGFCGSARHGKRKLSISLRIAVQIGKDTLKRAAFRRAVDDAMKLGIELLKALAIFF